jgi:putative transposase
VKTIVFKLNLARREQQTIDHWLSSLRWVWNHGLDLLFELETFTHAYSTTEEEGKKRWHRASCCPLPWKYRRIDINGDWEYPNLVPYTPIDARRNWRRGNPSFCCPLSQDYRQPRIENSSTFTLSKYFAHKRHPDKPWLCEIPAWFIRGTVDSLCNAWERYKSRKGGKPRYKGRSQMTDTLIHLDPKTFVVEPVNARDGLIRIPKLGKLRVKHLWADWGETVIKTLKISRQMDGYYLQLTGALPSDELPATERTVELSLPQTGDILAISDKGKEYSAAPLPSVHEVRRLQTLEKVRSRQKYLSNRWQKTNRKIAKIQRVQARRANAHNQKLSTFIVRTYGAIAVDDIKAGTLRKPRRRIKKGTIDPIEFDPNGAQIVSEINKSRTSLRVGQFVALIKQKAGQKGRVFAKKKKT